MGIRLLALSLILIATNACSDETPAANHDLLWKKHLFSSNFDAGNRENRKEVAVGILNKIIYIREILNKGISKKDYDVALKNTVELLREAESGKKDNAFVYHELLRSPEFRLARINSYLDRVQALLEAIMDDSKSHHASAEVVYWAKLNNYLSGPQNIGGDIVYFCKDHPISDEEKKMAFFVPPFEFNNPWSFYMAIGTEIQSKIVIPMLEGISEKDGSH